MMPPHRGANGDPVELRPNTSPTHPKVIVRDASGAIIEDVNFDPDKGVVIALDDLPTVGTVAVIPPCRTTHGGLAIPEGALRG